MKKILALLAAMALSCTMLVSCGDEDSSSKSDNSSTSSVADTSSAADDTSADASSEEDSSKDDTSSEADSSEEDSSSEADKPANNGGSVAGKLSATAKIENITEKETEDQLFKKLVDDITSTKTCTMDYELSQDGMSMKAIISMDKDNVYMDMDMLGMKITALITPDGSYYIDKDANKYYKEAGEDTSTEELGMSLVDEMSSLEGMEYVSSADCEIDGKAYVLETWKNTEQNVEMQYVFDGDDVVLVKQGDVQMPFLLSAKADSSLFTIDGMTEMTEEEYAAYIEALSGSLSGVE